VARPAFRGRTCRGAFARDRALRYGPTPLPGHPFKRGERAVYVVQFPAKMNQQKIDLDLVEHLSIPEESHDRR
jgi:hypothetical protein